MSAEDQVFLAACVACLAGMWFFSPAVRAIVRACLAHPFQSGSVRIDGVDAGRSQTTETPEAGTVVHYSGSLYTSITLTELVRLADARKAPVSVTGGKSGVRVEARPEGGVIIRVGRRHPRKAKQVQGVNPPPPQSQT